MANATENVTYIMLGDIWFVLLGLMLVLYVVLDGFDLGIGVLSLAADNEDQRGHMMSSIHGVWDANETWLVVLAGALFGAFPLAYGVLLHALYIPLLGMLIGLILRSIAFEFYGHSQHKQIWGWSFAGGSLLAALSQGFALGMLIHGIPVNTQQRFVGGPWDWLSPFSLLVGCGVTCGYGLLGATYLFMKTEGRLQQYSRRWVYYAGWPMMAIAAVITLWTPFLSEPIRQNWLEMFPWLGLLPVAGLAAFILLLQALKRDHEQAPFYWACVIFLVSFSGLALSLHPYIVPPALIAQQAAASLHTLVFMLTGVGMLLPVMMIYNGYQYLVFRGKVQKSS
jgi:cytochrome d ubiquinol oxidase subunit II